jgi:hypothetical protein
MLDLVEEPLDQVAGTIEIRADADRLSCDCLAEGYWPRAHRGGIGPDPVSVIASVRQQHRSRFQTRQELTLQADCHALPSSGEHLFVTELVPRGLRGFVESGGHIPKITETLRLPVFTTRSAMSMRGRDLDRGEG